MGNTDTIILSAGNINYLHLPISTNTSNAMVPVNGKPVIAWVLEDLIQKDIHEIILVHKSEDHKLVNFIKSVFQDRMSITMAPVKDSRSIVDSLVAGMQFVKKPHLRIVLGDTTIKDTYDFDSNVIYTSEVPDSHRWCLASVGDSDIIQGFWDKQYQIPKPHYAVCGYYHLMDADFARESALATLADGGTQLSDVLNHYRTKHSIKSVKADKWFDFGNIDNLIRAKQMLLQSRFFNQLTIDPVLKTITKVSQYDQKLRHELSWYESLPVELQVLSPRIINKAPKNGQLHLTQEYYGYPNLAELFMFSDLDVDAWESIIRNLFEIRAKLDTYQGPVSREDIYSMYWEKTASRLDQLEDLQPEFVEVFGEESIIINGLAYKNIKTLLPWVEEQCKILSSNGKGAIIHGDYCLSNILYDVNSQIVRLIDPRGSFGQTGIYGDPRYDMAKLRHSFNGLYDFIVGDLFNVVQVSSGEYTFTLSSGPHHQLLMNLFDSMLEDYHYNIDEIALIEALLFISMLPLHSDKPNRQKAMFLTGIIKLNKLYENRNRS